jgi:hypothetical protein
LLTILSAFFADAAAFFGLPALWYATVFARCVLSGFFFLVVILFFS